jgi:hypothetical protein
MLSRDDSSASASAGGFKLRVDRGLAAALVLSMALSGHFNRIIDGFKNFFAPTLIALRSWRLLSFQKSKEEAP